MGTNGKRVALITGGASGIGRATATRLVADGVTVVIGDIQDEAGATAVAELQGMGASASYVHLDVSDEASWQEAVNAIEREHGRLDILVNNAGIGDREPLEQTTLETYARVVAITQTSVFLGMKAAAQLLKQSGAGSVVNVSSIYGIRGGFGVSPGYAAAKGAVRTLTKNVAVLWATQGIRVNSIHPGFIETPILGDTDREPLVAVTPMGRLGTPAEVAEAIASWPVRLPRSSLGPSCGWTAGISRGNHTEAASRGELVAVPAWVSATGRETPGPTCAMLYRARRGARSSERTESRPCVS